MTSGMDIVNNIGKAMTGIKKGHEDVPLDTIKIEKVTIVD
ncbi:peptidyl-prolyl cis-trans isomerase PpiB [Vibrio variabilis]|uniref:Peptidyl-prolyl cis-trans isomerase PpiB n=1 Tax=Vibrio variabilis TaxID=990271 RepID=A0ABQ0JEP9_9VIBR|nr:peptidyl-prolyl cis-trans isomerase PpiB [Vibrio variabilis]